VAGASLAYKFECSRSVGGLLVTRDHATSTMVMPSVDINKYILQNHDSWYTFATNPVTYGLDCKPEDIILVRSTVKTSSWAVAAFHDSGGRTHDVSFAGQIGPFADAGFQMASQTSTQAAFEQRSGPNRRAPSLAQIPSRQSASSRRSLGRLELPELEIAATMSQTVVPEHTKDQTVFLGSYRIKRRFWVGRKVVAAGGSADLPEDEPPPTTPAYVGGELYDRSVELDVPQSTVSRARCTIVPHFSLISPAPYCSG
jgi:hypothetical protein